MQGFNKSLKDLNLLNNGKRNSGLGNKVGLPKAGGAGASGIKIKALN